MSQKTKGDECVAGMTPVTSWSSFTDAGDDVASEGSSEGGFESGLDGGLEQCLYDSDNYSDSYGSNSPTPLFRSWTIHLVTPWCHPRVTSLQMRSKSVPRSVRSS